MSHILGEQFRDRLADMGLSHVADSDEQYIRGDELSDIYERSGFVLRRSSPLEIGMTPYHRGGYEVSPSELDNSRQIRTSQTGLYRAGFLDYLEHGSPSSDPRGGKRPETPYLPYLFDYGPRGNTWAEDGHHRVITSRLRGEQSTPVYRESFPLPDPYPDRWP
jgi:hypothetical protein